MKRFEVRLTFNGCNIDDYDSLKEAADCIRENENVDKNNLDFVEDYYEIYDHAQGYVVDYYYTKEGGLVDNGFK